MHAAVLKVDERLSVNLTSVLGTGPKSIVYKGTFEGIPVAVKSIENDSEPNVKRDPSKAAKEALRERNILCQVEEDRRWNIMGFHYSVQQGKTTYLALQLCDGHLGKYIKNESLVSTYPPQRVNHDIAVAIHYLHGKCIVHRDLKPENIFYLLRGDRVERVLVGDFGFSKTTVEDMHSISGVQVGTQGYIAQEVWNQLSETKDVNYREKMTVKTDIFAIGCIFHYTVTGGKNPFGKFDSQANIGLKKLPDLKELESKQHILQCLLNSALSHNPEKRPNATEVLNHPAVWRSEKILKFLTDVSDEVKDLAPSNRSEIAKLENQNVIWGGNWCINLPENLRKYLDDYQENGKHIYRENSKTVCGTLRVIRNVANHYKEFPPEVREELESPPDGHLDVWFESCPYLFMHVYDKISEIRRNLGISCDLSEYTGLIVQQHRTTQQAAVHLPESQSKEPRQQTDIGATDQNTELKTIASSDLNENQSEEIRQRPDSGEADQTTELKTFAPSNFQMGAVSSLTEDVSNLNMSSTLGDARAKRQLWLYSEEKYLHGKLKVERQSFPKHHILDDMWMIMARKEIDDGRKTEVFHYLGQYYVLCVDISESMAEGSAWLQAKNFVESFISGLENLQKCSLGIPLYLALVTFGQKTEVVQRLTNEMKLVETAFDNLCLGGPTPMYGGISLGTATAGIPDRSKGNPTLIIITDGKPTETTLYAGPDSLDSSKEEKVKQEVVQALEKLKDGVDFTFVCVGNADSDFVNIMAAVCKGQVYSHTDGHAILKRHFNQEKNKYHERTDLSLPCIGSRVIRGKDWNYGFQDSEGPGTVIGHDFEGDIVWVEWDLDGCKSQYRYGLNGCYDVSLTKNHKREVSTTGQIAVGCSVAKEGDTSDPRNPKKVGTVIKVLQGGERVEVRWNDRTRGEYSFGEDNKFEVWPYSSDTTNTSGPVSTNAGENRNAGSTSTNKRQYKNKNLR